VIWPEATIADAIATAERLRQAVAELAIEHAEGGASGTVTVSIGGATANADRSTSRERLFKAADQALYRAKSEGRNRVSFESSND